MNSGKQKIKRIVFDVDGTLIDWNDFDRTPAGLRPKKKDDVITLMRAFNKLGWKIYVHSGGGIKYAENWIKELGLDKEMHIYIAMKGDKNIHFDIAVDDDALEIEAAKKRGEGHIDADYFIKI